MNSNSSSAWLARGAVIGSAICLMAFSSIAHAATFRGGESMMIPAGETVVGDVYGGGGTVSVLGQVTGDLVSGGGTVTVQGPVTQDVMVGGGNVTLLGPVGDDVRVGGGNIIVGGKVTGDVVAAGGTIHILQGASVGGDVVAAGGSITIDGPVAGKVYVRGGQLIINSSVAQGVDAEVQSFSLGSAARITGGMVYKAPNEVTQAEGASVAGQVAYTPIESNKLDAKTAAAGFATFMGMVMLIKLVIITVTALLAVWFLGPLVQAVVQRAYTHPGDSAILGLAMAVVPPVAAIILLFTVVGIALAAMGLLVYALFLMIAKVVLVVYAGALLARMIRGHIIVDWKWTIAGSLATFVIMLIPFLGWLIMTVLFLVTLGALGQVLYKRAREIGMA